MSAEPIKMALQSLWSHKLRSTMTVLGVVIGVASVLAVTSLGAAFEDSLVANFDDLDDRSIFVTASAGDPTQGPPDAGQFGLIFTEVDLQSLRDIQGVERVVPSGEVGITRIALADKEIPFRSLTATTPDADELRRPADYASGGPFSLGAEETVLGATVAKSLNASVGDAITISYEDGSEASLTVTGVLALQESLFGSNNGQVFVPVDPFYQIQARSPSSDALVRVYSGFTVFADDARTIDATQERVDNYLQRNSDAAQLLQEDIIILVSTPSDITASIGTAFDQVTIFIAAIAGVSLLVAGIMIASVMLISVAERTKEIGMMKAIGATDGFVLRMFLQEAAIIGLLGSLLGIGLGLAGGAIMVETLFVEEGETVAFVVPWDWVAISVLVGVSVALIAGILPSSRAVRIQPVEALSYE